MEFDLGDLVWIFPHDELSWCPGEICKIEGDAYIAIAKDSEDESLYRIEKKNAIPVHPSCLQKVPDLLLLGDFNEGALLHNVRSRYFEDKIYTSVGIPILISLNPYTKLPIYSPKIAKSYKGQSDKNSNPHLYLMAEKAYTALKDGNQSIIISGESGSGKTEAAKIILSYLAETSDNSQNNLSKQVLDTNPILEAFGNAKTLRNDNSSRFGKFIEIHFDSISLKLLSARIQNYLLEKSRIVSQQTGERNYHFFYQICSGATDEEREKYHIFPPSEFNYLNKSDCLEIEGVDDSENYRETIECMNVLGFSSQERDGILRIVMGILHLGNVGFEGEEEASVSTFDSLETACDLLGIKIEIMEKVLTTRVIIDPTNNKEIIMKQNVTQSYYTRDATAKAIYSKLFTWLVERINKSIYIQQKKPSKIIGLLDIYGFEVFDINSFEQFCINYANEKLQQHFNHHMFKLEQQVYSKEKIKWDHINYEDNQTCIDLIEKTPIGIISLMDEQTKLQKGKDKQFLSNLYSKLSNNPKLCNAGPYVNEFFGIGHYAGDVYYNVNGFLEKNKDTLNPQLIRAVEKSSLSLMCEMFVVSGKSSNKSAPGSLSALTLGSQFKSQLQDLIKALSGSNPSYIRCIKPNSEKSPKVFDSQDVQRQLRCAGMLECIRIRKAGYSVRRNLKEFIDKYWIIAPSCRKNKDESSVTQCKRLISELSKMTSLAELIDSDKRMIQLGISMIFMKDEIRQALDIEYTKAAYQYSLTIQKYVRGYFQRKKYKNIKNSIFIIQANVKKWLLDLRRKRKEKYLRSSLRSLALRKKLSLKRKAVTNIKKFLIRAASKIYISYFKPSISNRVTLNSEELFIAEQGTEKSFSSPKSVSEETTKSTEEKYKRSSYIKEYTSGQTPVIDTLQREMKNLSYLLTREKQKSKTAQEEALYYKNLYQETLSQIQSIQIENQMISVSTEKKSRDSRSRAGSQNLQTELNSKNNEISLLQLKIQSLTESVEEIQEINNELKKKEKGWKNKLDTEIKKYSQENEELKKQIQMESFEKNKNDLAKYEKEIRGLKLSLRALESENSNLNGIINDQKLKINDYEEIENELRAQIKNLQEETNKRNDNFSRFENEKSKNLMMKIAELQKELESERDEFDDLQEEKENLKSENERLLSSEIYYKQEISKYQKQNKERQMIIKDLENQIEAFQHEKIEFTRAKIELQSLKSSKTIDRDSQFVKDLKEQLNELAQENEEISKELESSKQIHSTLLTLLKIKNSEIEIYKESSFNPTERLSVFQDEEKKLLAQ